MTRVPTTPDEFFGSYLAESFAPLRARLGNLSSPGAVVFRIGERPPLAVRISNGALQCSPEAPGDTIVQISLAEADFAPVLVRGAEQLAQHSGDPDRQLAVLRALTLESDRIELIRKVKGSVAFVLVAPQGEHRITLTPGSQSVNLTAAECTVRCSLADFLAMQGGAANPVELMMNGKLQISGDAQIPMALSSLLM